MVVMLVRTSVLRRTCKTILTDSTNNNGRANVSMV